MVDHRATTSDTACGRNSQRPKGLGSAGFPGRLLASASGGACRAELPRGAPAKIAPLARELVQEAAGIHRAAGFVDLEVEVRAGRSAR